MCETCVFVFFFSLCCLFLCVGFLQLLQTYFFFSSESWQQQQYRSPDLTGTVPRLSPRSTLEAIPSPSPSQRPKPSTERRRISIPSDQVWFAPRQRYHMKDFFFLFLLKYHMKILLRILMHMCVSMYVGSLGVEGRRVVYVTFYSTVELRKETWFFLFRGFLEEELCINDVLCTFGSGYIIF